MNLTERCTDKKELNILVQIMLDLALADIEKRGVKVEVRETYRPQERQNYLYCQGRTINECTTKGISTQFAKAYSSPKAIQVTWTLNSVHKSRKAVDVVPYINGKLTWSHTAKEQLIIVECMSKYGFECGTNWTKNRDSCHYQVKGDFDKVFDKEHNTSYVTKAIQTKLNERECNKLDTDGKWGPATIAAINRFRYCQGYKTRQGQIGATALKDLFR